ncbi:MAG: SGNH/GDSL hydrolase family protein [Thermoanaerobaculia bacterium]
MTRFLALGDSYTIGEAVPPAERWPALLAERLALSEPQIIARTGWTTEELSAALDDAKPAGPFDLVSLLIGVNNQYRGGDAESYRAEFADLLRRAIGFAGEKPRRVVVVSIPDWGVTPFAGDRNAAQIAADIDRFNAVNREEAERAGAHYADIVSISREAKTDPSLTAGDGLHPSGAMYRRWVGIILPKARLALAS